MRLTIILATFCSSALAAEEGSAVSASGELVVEAERLHPDDPSATSAAVTVLPVDETLPASADVGSLVGSASGVTVRRLGGLGDYAAVSVRGSAERAVQIYLDGFPLNPDGGAAVNLSELPLRAFEAVEVWRGNAPARFAAAPLGGVVSLRAPGRAPPQSGALSAGSLDTWKASLSGGAAHALGPGQGDALFLIDGFDTAGDFTYFDDNGTPYALTDDHLRRRDNNQKLMWSGLARARWSRGPLQLMALDAPLYRDEGLPGHANNPSQHARLVTTRNLAGAGLAWCGSGGAVEARAWQIGRRELLDDRHGEIGVNTNYESGHTTATGLLAHGALAPLPWLAPALTLSARRDGYRLHDLAAGELGEPRARWALSAAASADLFALEGRLRTTGVLQGFWLDNHAVGADAVSIGSLSPRLGARLSLSPAVAIKGNLGRYLRPPDFSELFGDRGAVEGNPDLVPERGWQADLGLRAQLPDRGWLGGSVDLTGFGGAARDLITYVQNSQRTLVPINIGRSSTAGLEGALQLQLGDRVDLQGNATLTRAINRSEDPAWSGKQLPRVPAFELDARASVHWGEQARVGYSFSYTDGNWWDATNWYRAAPRALHGAFVRLAPPASKINVELDALNLTDRIVQVVPRDPLDADSPDAVAALTDFGGYPLPGRTFLLSFRWQI